MWNFILCFANQVYVNTKIPLLYLELFKQCLYTGECKIHLQAIGTDVVCPEHATLVGCVALCALSIVLLGTQKVVLELSDSGLALCCTQRRMVAGSGDSVVRLHDSSVEGWGSGTQFYGTLLSKLSLLAIAFRGS